MDIYTTDAKIDHLGLLVLQDDQKYFPRYDAVLLYRLDVPTRLPKAWAALQALEGKVDEHAMIAMNARAELQSVPFDVIARDFIAAREKTARRSRLTSSAASSPSCSAPTSGGLRASTCCWWRCRWAWPS
jgi:osmoprotectant transport system permease protein